MLEILFVINVKNMDILKNSVIDIIKLLKKISKLEFEKDIINELIKMFDINPKEIDQVKEKKELKSTNPIKVNKRKRNKKRHNNEITR